MPTAVTPRPNIVLIHCHDLGRHLGCYGASTVRTPNLDALAERGTVATGMLATAPQCSPSRAGLFTGRWPHVNGVMGLTHPPFAWDLAPGEHHLAELLRGQGYRTGIVGVMHEAAAPATAGGAERLGFDHVALGGLADEVVTKTADALDRLAADDSPFYLQTGFIEPHRLPGPRDAPGVMGFLGDHLEPDDAAGVAVPAYLDDTASAREEVAELQGAIHRMDAAVGEILAALDARGLTDDTVVIFTTDHGLALPRAKCSLYEAGLEVAFVISWPGRIASGQRIDPMLSNLDVVPTLMEILGVAESPDPQRPWQGRSFWPLLCGEPYEPREALCSEMTYHDYYDPRRAVRTADHKLIVNFTSAPLFMDPSQSWLRRCTPRSSAKGNVGAHPIAELYDLTADPYELDNLIDDAAQRPVRDELLGLLHAWMTATDDPLLSAGAAADPLTSPHHRTAADLITGPR